MVTHTNDSELSSIFKQDSQLASTLKQYIKLLLKNEIRKIKGPIISVENLTIQVGFEEAMTILVNFLNSSSMYQSQWSQFVQECIGLRRISVAGCVLKRTRVDCEDVEV